MSPPCFPYTKNIYLSHFPYIEKKSLPNVCDPVHQKNILPTFVIRKKSGSVYFCHLGGSGGGSQLSQTRG